MESERAGPSLPSTGAGEKTPLLRTRACSDATDIRLVEDGSSSAISPSHRKRAATRRKGSKRRRILSILLIIVLCWALLRRVIPYTSSWVCLSASRFFLISTTKCALPSWYDVKPDAVWDFNSSNFTETIPQYVYDYAPLVHLFSDERFWPCDMSEHLNHTTPDIDYTPIDLDPTSLPSSLNLSNLNRLNSLDHGRHVFLTSNDDVETHPTWLVGEKNKPSPFTTSTIPNNPHHRRPISNTNDNPVTHTYGGRSTAPAVLISVPKPHGILDAFYFFFYSYNHGNEVLRLRFGNHVGDWEHTMIRFQHGIPKAVFFSEHNFGTAYAYSAVEKVGKRPVLYSATGTHAMYATPGLQPYILPLGLLHDKTDRGPTWDPTQNLVSYTFDHIRGLVYPSTTNPKAPTSWFYYAGHWGDKHYPLGDHRQYSFLGEYHYVSGPLGPRYKHLGRRKVCQGPYEEPCELKHWLGRGLGVSNDVGQGGEREGGGEQEEGGSEDEVG